MPKVTKEQIKQAKEWDLLSYLQTYQPQEVKKCGRKEYCTRTHDSLKISNGKWYWHSRGIGGKTALDYLIKVRGMDFISAVETLCEEQSMIVKKQPLAVSKQKQSNSFLLPEKNSYGMAMVSYLQKRGIDTEIINYCIGKGLLYESRSFRNCVFVGYDLEGKARYACLRGTYHAWKQEVDGSDKRYSFFLPAVNKNTPFLAVTESPIDALSLASLLKMQGEDWTKNYYLSLGGTSSLALFQFLQDHPSVTWISLCLDNDKAGWSGMKKIKEAIKADPELSQRIKGIIENPPPLSCGKDYNEWLQKKIVAFCNEKKQTIGQKDREK